jgi:hypothetical protein
LFGKRNCIIAHSKSYYFHSFVIIGFEHFYSGNLESRVVEPRESAFWDANSFAVFGSWEWLLTENLYAPMGVVFIYIEIISTGNGIVFINE